MSGLEVLKRIRERNSPVSLPVIMVTVNRIATSSPRRLLKVPTIM